MCGDLITGLALFRGPEAGVVCDVVAHVPASTSEKLLERRVFHRALPEPEEKVQDCLPAVPTRSTE